MLGCKYLFFVCRYHLHTVAWFSYWFDNLGFITEGNTYRSCAASSLPLRGKTDMDTSHQGRISDAVVGETSATSTRFLITNLISLLCIIFHFPLIFISPTSQKFAFLFALFFVYRFLVGSIFDCVLVCLLCRYGYFFLYCVYPQERGS